MAFSSAALLDSSSLPETETAPFVPVTASSSTTDAADEALGCGLLVPFARDGKGDFVNGCGLASIRSSIQQILGINAKTDTTHGDLEWRPEFGSQLDRIRHMPADESTVELARYYVIDALRIWEKRINIIDALIEYEDNNTPGAGDGGKIMVITVFFEVVGMRRGALLQETLTLNTISAAA